MSKIKTYSLSFQKEQVVTITTTLIEKSQWFSVTPLPEDVYEISVKEENKLFLDDLKKKEDKKLVSIDMEQGLFVIPTVERDKVVGFSCLGFEVAQRQRNAVRDWLGQPPVTPLEDIGDQEALRSLWKSYKEAMKDGEAYHCNTGKRCPSELMTRFIGLEGKRVRVTHANGEEETYKISRSTGWMPIHIAIKGREHSGFAVYLPEDSVFVVID